MKYYAVETKPGRPWEYFEDADKARKRLIYLWDQGYWTARAYYFGPGTQIYAFWKGGKELEEYSQRNV